MLKLILVLYKIRNSVTQSYVIYSSIYIWLVVTKILIAMPNVVVNI